MKDNSLKGKYGKYVADIDTAQRLYACGFKQDTLFFWIANPVLDSLALYRGDWDYQGDPAYRFAAPTAPEIKENFPLEIWVTLKTRSHIKRPGVFHYSQYQGKHVVSLMIRGMETNQIYELYREEDINEANAVGRMLCYILENHLDQVNA